MIDQNDLRNILRHRCEAAGGAGKWAAANDIFPQYVSAVLRGKVAGGNQIANALGYEKKTVYFACNPEKESA